MRKKSGFTLAEMVVTLGIIGVIASIIMPALNKTKPNTEMLMLKKAYSLIGRGVYELINDDDLYPEEGDGTNFGFSNTTEGQYKGQKFSGDVKFCKAFAVKLNLTGTESCGNHSFTNGNTPVGDFTTTDGIVWILPKGNFASAATLVVDVNGVKKPNCLDPASANDNASCPEPDRFQFSIDKWGKINILGTVAPKYLNAQNFTQKASELK